MRHSLRARWPELRGPSRPHSGAIRSIAISGGKMLTAGSEGHVCLWDLRSGRQIWRSAPIEGLTGAVFSDADAIVGVRRSATPLVRLARDNGRLVARLRAPGPVDAVGLSADGRYAVLSSDPPSCDPENADDGLEVDDEEAPTAEVRFWDLTLDALAGSDTAQMNDVFHVALSPDGALASLSGEDRFIVLRCPSGEFVASLGTDLDHMVACGNVFSSSFSADSRTIAFGVELGILSVRGIERTRSNFSTTSSPADANIAPQRRGCIGAVAWAPDGKRIAAGCDRGVISFHRVDGGVGPSVCELKGEVTALHVLDDELIAGTDEGRLFRIPLEAFGSLRGGSVHRAARPVRIVPRDHGRPADAKSKLFRPDDRVRLMANPTLIGIVRVFNAGADSVQVEWDHAPGHVEAAHSWELDLIVPERP